MGAPVPDLLPFPKPSHMRTFTICLFLAGALVCAAASLLLPPDFSGGASAEDARSREILALQDLASMRRIAAEDARSREILGYTIRQEKKSMERPHFRPSAHFLVESVPVEIICAVPGAQIHYTLDGSRPTRNSTAYTGPFSLSPGKGRTCIVVKAVAVIDGRESAVSTHSYFFGFGSRLPHGPYVFSLSAEKEDLYGHDAGILVPGKLREESVRRFPEKEEHAHNANYKGRGRDWERTVDVEIFHPDGSRLLAQKAGMRVIGAVSRHFAQKSLRFIARKAYEPGAGKFKYPFFPELAREDARFPVLAYDNLVLSSGGQDLEDAQIRTPLLTHIAAQAGYAWTTPVHSAAVYLNGTYYGHAWLSTRLDDGLLESFFARPRKDFVVLNGGVRMLRSSPKYPELLHWRSIRKFVDLVGRCGQERMNEDLYRAIQEQIDVDNLLLYYAIQCYIENRDWPGDNLNVRVWRYTGQEGGKTPELDGRWRYVLYDLDVTALSSWSGSRSPALPTLGWARGESPLFSSLLERPELAARFANNMCDMAFVHYTEENVRRVMGDLDAVSLDEIRYAAQHGQYSPPGLQQTIDRGRETILAFFRQRPEHALNELRHLFGYTDLYCVTVEGPARLNTIDRPNPEGWYFVENSVTVAAALPPHKAVRHWEVNGQIRTGDRITISSGDALAGHVRVRLVTEDRPPPLVLENAYDHGHVCGFSLRNTTNASLEVKDVYVSDRLAKPRKYDLSGIVFGPGETIPFVGKGARHVSALKKMQVNFRPSQGETLYLRDGTGRILSSVVVP